MATLTVSLRTTPNKQLFVEQMVYTVKKDERMEQIKDWRGEFDYRLLRGSKGVIAYASAFIMWRGHAFSGSAQGLPDGKWPGKSIKHLHGQASEWRQTLLGDPRDDWHPIDTTKKLGGLVFLKEKPLNPSEISVSIDGKPQMTRKEFETLVKKLTKQESEKPRVSVVRESNGKVTIRHVETRTAAKETLEKLKNTVMGYLDNFSSLEGIHIEHFRKGWIHASKVIARRAISRFQMKV